MKIGICGGTFNPPHNAHKNLIEKIINDKIADKIIVLPTNNKYNKSEIINLTHRINMLKLAFLDNVKVEIESEEIAKRNDYTIDALNYYQKRFNEDEICFIMGSDNLKEFMTWKNWQEIVEDFSLIVVIRNDDSIEYLSSLIPNAKIKFVREVGNLSSTAIRNAIKENKNIENYLEKNVINYINEYNLYV